MLTGEEVLVVANGLFNEVGHGVLSPDLEAELALDDVERDVLLLERLRDEVAPLHAREVDVRRRRALDIEGLEDDVPLEDEAELALRREQTCARDPEVVGGAEDPELDRPEEQARDPAQR